MTKKVTIYEIRDEESQPLSFHATKGDANKEMEWWRTKGGIEPTFHEYSFTLNKKGIAGLLNSLFTGYTGDN